MDKREIKDYKFIKKLEILPFVEAIYLFGSRTQNKHPQFSDIDLAIVCPKATILEWQKILDIIDQADTLLKIDCIRYDSLPTGKFKQEIDKNKKIIYERTNNN